MTARLTRSLNALPPLDVNVVHDQLLAADQRRQLFSADEKLVLEMTDAITATAAAVSPELRERLKKRFSVAELQELASAVAFENYRARSNRVFGFESENFFEP